MNTIETPEFNEFTIQIDQREQAPFLFDNIRSDSGNLIYIPRNDATLKSGDYSIQYMENQIAIERKSHIDLLGSIGKGRARFQREMERLNEMEYAAVVIEAGWKELLIDGHRNSQMNPKTIARTITSWSIRYPTVHWWPCMDKRHAELMTFRLLERFWELKKLKEV